MKLKVIITGVTGMVGEGVLYECLEHTEVESILVIGRRPCGVSHPKLKEIVHKDLSDISTLEDTVKEYNACFFCLGTTSIGKSEEEYYKATYVLTTNFASVLSKSNPDMIFSYISGGGTDSTEKGKLMWARVKGKTENDLMKMPFKKVYNFRPGYLHPTKGLKNTIKYYKYITWLYPVFKILMPDKVSTLSELGEAMINTTLHGYHTQIIEIKDIHKIAG